MRAALLVALVAACAFAAEKEEGQPPEEGIVEIVGNQEVSERGLKASARRELRAFFEEGRRAADASDAAHSMELHLRREGYANGSVAFRIEEERLVFTVTEGSRVELDVVVLTGVRSVSTDTLLKYFDYPDRPVFRLMEIEAGAQNLEHFYLLQGYLRVRVGEPQVTWNEERTRANVVVAVEEGQRFEIEAVEFEGIDPVDLGLVGEPYHVRRPSLAAARVRGLLREKGLQFAKVRAEPEIDEKTGAVTIRFVAEPGPTVRLGQVTIEGNERTKTKFVRNRIPIELGSVLTQDLLDRAADNLYRTQVFSSVRTRLEPTADDVADLHIQLKELEARSVDFEVGWGAYELLRGAVRYRDRNIFGWGRRFRTDVTASMRGYGIEARIEDPYLLSERDTVQLGGGYRFREEPSFDRTEIFWDLSIRHVFSDLWSMRYGYAFRTQEATNISGAIAPAEQAGFVASAGLFATLTRDTRDSVLNPSEGYLMELGAAFSTPVLGADLEFVGLDFSWWWFRRLGARHVLGWGFRGRTKENLDESLTLPIQERLFLGGPTTVRSFFQDRLGPTNLADEPIGGLTSVYGSVELRSRVWGDLHTALFFDVGEVNVQSFSLDGEPGYGIGAGLRYLLPVGPLRLDVAYNPGDLFASSSRWAIHFAFGFSF
ncbi:MAG: BamA/OMP85 family outer membrane protein [Planctomycetota bacterium]